MATISIDQVSTSTSLRSAIVATMTAAAVAHLPVIAPHLEEAPYMGVLFIALTGACLALAAVIASRDTTWAYQATIAVCGAAVLGYAATRIVAFPMLAEDVGNWFEPLGVVSVLTESATVAFAAIALRRRARTR